MLKAPLAAIAVAAALSGTALAQKPLPAVEQRVLDTSLSITKRQVEGSCRADGNQEACKNARHFEHRVAAPERARFAKDVRALTPAQRHCLRQVGEKNAKRNNSPGEAYVPKECKIPKSTAKEAAAEMYYSTYWHNAYNTRYYKQHSPQ